MNANQYHREVNRLNRRMDMVRAAINFHLDAIVDNPEEAVFQDAVAEIAEYDPVAVLRAIDEHSETVFLQTHILYIVEFAIGRSRLIPAPVVIPVREVK